LIDTVLAQKQFINRNEHYRTFLNANEPSKQKRGLKTLLSNFCIVKSPNETNRERGEKGGSKNQGHPNVGIGTYRCGISALYCANIRTHERRYRPNT
jgi:hypothetical protein